MQKKNASVEDRNLEIKDALSELHPLSGVRNCLVKATLRQSNHLKHTETKFEHASVSVFNCTFH